MEELIMRAAGDLVKSQCAIALTGAGISTESGISDFRGPQGVWTKNPDAERRAYQNYQHFLDNPAQWWEERLNSPPLLGDVRNMQPNAGHFALVELEMMGILKWVITQNVDALHEKAGTKNLLEYHGNLTKLRCTSCGVRLREVEFDLQKLLKEGKLPPHCPRCRGIIKYDTVAFGEAIPSDVAYKSQEEAMRCDLMLICGTSAVVYPFATLPRLARQRGGVTIIEINAEPTPLTEEGISDYLLQGKTGEILPRIVAEVKKLRK